MDSGQNCMPPTYDIQLGAFTASYFGYETTAPKDYDGFGTISLHDVAPGERRWVLIRVEHASWQVTRYQSGGHEAGRFGEPRTEATLEDVRAWITEQLYTRLLGGKER